MSGNQMDTTCAGIVNAININLRNNNISNLTGIEYFDEMTILNCNKNQLTSLPQLPQYLEYLYCDSNQLTSLPELPLGIREVYCSSNQLTVLPSLPNGSFFSRLYCNNNLLTSLPALPSGLIRLFCFNNQLTSLPNDLNGITQLRCQNNQLTNLPPLPNNLINLYCNDNQLSTLPDLPNSLTVLYCFNNQLTSLPTLPTSLNYLACESNQLTSLPTLPNSLVNFFCSDNQLTSISNLPNLLNTLYCSNNLINSLPPFPNLLTQLDCSNNQLMSLPTVPSSLQTFRINNNNISCLVNLPNSSNGNISNNPLFCVPNQTNYSLGLPLCTDSDPVSNPNNCPGVNITGTVYKDLNNNCALNTTDLRSQNIPIKLYDNQNNFLAQSYTINGVYSFNTLLPDTFQVKIDTTNLPIAIACGQNSTQSVTLTSTNQTIQNINFPVVCNAAFDATVQSVSRNGWVFPGQTHTLETNVTNNSNWYNLNCTSTIVSGTVSIQVTGPVSFVAPAPGALTPIVSGNTFTYNIPNFNTLNPNSFGLNFMTDTTAQANDQICVHVE
ncbi:MAG: hypothetical protein ACK455_03850, partial [Bacteroidota bacterium]